jgi:hypothetical protein|nr:tetratricopeptide repeat protein [Kofleriaceae bacterium]
MGSFRAVAALVACSLVTTPAISVVAQPGPKDAQTQARDLVNQATDKSKAGDHKAAIELYLQAYNIAPLAILLSNVGSEYEKLDDAVDALKYFCKYLEKEPDGPMASYATSHAKDQQGKLHNPVDDQTVCKPLPQNTGSGAGSADTGAGSGSAGGTGTGSAGGTGTGSPGSTGGTTETSSDAGHTQRLVGLGAAGAGVIGLGLGVYFGLQAQDQADLITNHAKGTPWPNNIGQIESDGSRDQTLQITFLVVGGVLVIGGAALWYLGRTKPAEEHASLRPVVTPGYGGFALSGHF